MEQRFDFVGRLDGRQVLGDGSVRFTARLTRIGVFDYGDHAELRTPEEVFKPESMASFKGITVTDGHRAFVDPENWKTVAAGHVGDDVHQDGEFLVASIIVKDKSILEKIDAKKLVELSMGYTVNLDATPGVTASGEKYDSIQREIVGNHAALGPANWGRAGSSVRLLDGAAYAEGMTLPAQRIDAPSDTLAADLAASRADADAVRKERDSARADLEAAKKRADSLEAERDAAQKEAETAKADAAKARNDASVNFDAAVESRVVLVDAARGILGAEFVFAGKSDKEIRVAAILKADANAKLEGKSDGYIERSFELACEAVKSDRKDLGAVNEATAKPKGSEGEKSVLDAAYDKAEADRKLSAQAGPPAGATTRTKK